MLKKAVCSITQRFPGSVSDVVCDLETGVIYFAGSFPTPNGTHSAGGFICTQTDGEEVFRTLGPEGLKGRHICLMFSSKFGGKCPLIITEDNEIWGPDRRPLWQYKGVHTNLRRATTIYKTMPYRDGFLISTGDDPKASGVMHFVPHALTECDPVLFGTGVFKAMGSIGEVAAMFFVDRLYAVDMKGTLWEWHEENEIWAPRKIFPDGATSIILPSLENDGAPPLVVGTQVILAGNFNPKDLGTTSTFGATPIAIFNASSKTVTHPAVTTYLPPKVKALAATPNGEILYLGWRRTDTVFSNIALGIRTGLIEKNIFPEEFDIHHLVATDSRVYAAVTDADNRWSILSAPHPTRNLLP